MNTFWITLAAQVLASATGLWLLFITRPDEEDWSRESPRWIILPIAFVVVGLLTWLPEIFGHERF
jgi:hypothetical protein